MGPVRFEEPILTETTPEFRARWCGPPGTSPLPHFIDSETVPIGPGYGCDYIDLETYVECTRGATFRIEYVALPEADDDNVDVYRCEEHKKE
jgi:hypothetical protein